MRGSFRNSRIDNLRSDRPRDHDVLSPLTTDLGPEYLFCECHSERDLQCGCKAFRREAWDALTVICDGFAFDKELVAKAHKKGFAIAEVPVKWCNKANSKVKVRQDVLAMLRCLLSVRAQIRGDA